MSDKLGHRLAMARHAKKLSQQMVAKEVGISQKHLSQVEKGRTPFLSLSSGTLLRLASLLEVTTDFLLEGALEEDGVSSDCEPAVA